MAIHDIDILVKLVNRCIARYALPLWSSSMLICHSHIVYPSTNPQILNFPISWAKMQDFTTRIYQMRNIWIPNFMLFLLHCQMMPSRQYTVIINPRWGCWAAASRITAQHLLPVHNLRGPHADLGQLRFSYLQPGSHGGTVSSCISISSWFCSKIDRGKTWRLGQWTMTLQTCILLCQYILLSISTYHIQRGTNTAADVD